MVSLPGVTVSVLTSTDALAEGVPADGDALVVEVGDEQAASANVRAVSAAVAARVNNRVMVVGPFSSMLVSVGRLQSAGSSAHRLTAQVRQTVALSDSGRRRLIVCNFVTVDGRYEDDDHDIASFFEYQHPDYQGADTFDHCTTGLLRNADVLLLSGRRSALGNLSYWCPPTWPAAARRCSSAPRCCPRPPRRERRGRW
jgi:hypothetical protein